MLFHAVPVLWRLHRMHHADLDIDVTTGVRFHPVEILLSLLIKFAVIALLGAPALAVLIFEVLLNATSMFNHSNVRMPAAVDRIVRLLVVTPDMHRVHHSIVRAETNSNFGFNFPWWDRLFGTYRRAARCRSRRHDHRRRGVSAIPPNCASIACCCSRCGRETTAIPSCARRNRLASVPCIAREAH